MASGLGHSPMATAALPPLSTVSPVGVVMPATELAPAPTSPPSASGSSESAASEPTSEPTSSESSSDPAGGLTPSAFEPTQRSGRMPDSLHRMASSWRWPARPGEMPLYVQRSFRLKVYGLLSIQLTIVMCLLFAVRALVERFNVNETLLNVCFYTMGALAVLGTMMLRLYADAYPWNYIGLAEVTLMVGVFWGLLPPHLSYNYLHIQVLAIVLFSALGNFALAPLMTCKKHEPWSSILVSHFMTWLVGSAVDVVLAFQFGVSTYAWSLVAATLAGLLITAALTFGGGTLMVHCNPDSFLHVVLAMDCGMLVVTSPLFLFASFLFCTYPYPEEVDLGPPELHAEPEPSSPTEGP
mmetsp:Transcript_97408/g.313845  ORF Transcript_97408/g.313845 Transcript_97408/m.313845 type:complete len:354 (-) Transcript_97408:468-1529(-)